MTTNDMMNAIISAFPEVNFVQIGNNEFVYSDGVTDDGETIYRSVKFGTKATKDTKTHKAFDLDTAVLKYDEQKAKATERAAKPKNGKVKEITPEQAALVSDVREVLEDSASGLNAQEIAANLNASRDADHQVTWQKVSSILKKFAEDGTCNTGERDGKRIYMMA